MLICAYGSQALNFILYDTESMREGRFGDHDVQAIVC